MSLYLSRVRISPTPSMAALAKIIEPKEEGRAMDAHHRLIWGLFADTPERDRDFLWRRTGKGEFMTLSARPPQKAELFEEPETKEFDPDLASGDRVAFSLRVNATRTRSTPREDGRSKKQRVDIVMDALYHAPGDRAEHRDALTQIAAEDWMRRQGGAHGFALVDLSVSSYSAVALPGEVGPRGRLPKFGILDLEGMITVTNPAEFIAKYGAGFGRAKAFGCGLMLVRRA